MCIKAVQSCKHCEDTAFKCGVMFDGNKGHKEINDKFVTVFRKYYTRALHTQYLKTELLHLQIK
jgi:hypothetical protein